MRERESKREEERGEREGERREWLSEQYLNGHRKHSEIQRT